MAKDGRKKTIKNNGLVHLLGTKQSAQLIDSKRILTIQAGAWNMSEHKTVPALFMKTVSS